METNGWIAPEYDYVHLIQEVEQQFSTQQGNLIDQSAFYLDADAAAGWDELCQQTQYLSHYNPPSDWSTRMTQIILHHLRNSSFDKNLIDVIGLGVGGGHKETTLCESLLREKAFEKLRCFLLDVSPTLAQKAYLHFVETIGKRSNTEASWVLGNIHNLPQYTSLFYKPEDAQTLRVGTLFDVFGNIRHETNFIAQSLRAFKSGDLLIIETSLGFAPIDNTDLIKRKDPTLNSTYGLEWIEGVIRRYRPQTQKIDFEFQLKQGVSTFPKAYTIEIIAKVDDEAVFSVFQKHRYSADEFLNTFAQLRWKPLDGILYGPEQNQLIYVFAKE